MLLRMLLQHLLELNYPNKQKDCCKEILKQNKNVARLNPGIKVKTNAIQGLFINSIKETYFGDNVNLPLHLLVSSRLSTSF